MLETERLRLRPLAEEHAPHFHALFAGDWEAVRQTGRMPYPPREAAVRLWIRLHLQPGGHGFLVMRKDDSTPLGAAGFGGNERSAELGYAFGRAHWGRGYATETVCGLIGHARALGLNELQAFSFLDNPASTRVLRKAGFEELGVVERSYKERGGMRRVHHFRYVLGEAVEP